MSQSLGFGGVQATHQAQMIRNRVLSVQKIKMIKNGLVNEHMKLVVIGSSEKVKNHCSTVYCCT